MRVAKPIQIGGFKSEALTDGLPGNDGNPVLGSPEKSTSLGGMLYHPLWRLDRATLPDSGETLRKIYALSPARPPTHLSC